MAWDKTWEYVYKNRDWGKYPNEELIKFMARNFYSNLSRSNIKILELGCGPGANMWYLAREGFEIHGIDGSSTAIKKCIKRLNTEVKNWKGKIQVGDIVNIPYPNNFFDAVVDLEAVTHNSFEHSIQIYDESFRVLKNNGKIFSRTFANGTWGESTGKKMGRNAWSVNAGPMKNHCNIVRFTKKNQIKTLFKKFKKINIEKTSYSLKNQKYKINEWLIYGKKSTRSK